MCPQSNSTHRVEVVPVVLENHPNADSLSVVRVFGYPVVVRTEDWVGKSLGAYVPPDSLVPVEEPEFEFLSKEANADGFARIRAKKFRGTQSFGLLVHVPDSLRGDWVRVGNDLTLHFGVKHYEPPMKGFGGFKGVNLGGDVSPPPPGFQTNKYDIEAGRRYAGNVFVRGERVLVTEKIHGANTRIVYAGGRIHVGSRSRWLREVPDYSHVTHDFLITKGMDDEGKRQAVIDRVGKLHGKRNEWYKILDKHPEIVAFCENYPGDVLYGELYGCVQDLNYGHTNGDVSFAAFDVLTPTHFHDPAYARKILTEFYVPQVPSLGWCDYDFDKICALAEGQSLVLNTNHVREGVVVKPAHERWDDGIGRVILKWVGAGYLERKGG